MPRVGAPLLAACVALAGCASLPRAGEFSHAASAYPGGTLPPARDGRARFREIFCGLSGADSVSCDDLLWRLADEPAQAGPPAPLPPMRVRLRVFVVSGAFGDCRKPDTVPYGDGISRLAAEGLGIEAVMVSGRSGPRHNARQLAARIEAAEIPDNERIVLIGYSKGAVDILQFMIDFPGLAERVGAVVSVAGPIYGSPLASDADWWYRTFFTNALRGMCDPGDGGVVSSLLPDARRQWLEDHPLPGHVAYLSLAAFTTAEHMARGLRLSWRLLARTDRRNDGQVLVGDAVIPGSAVLGYVNADHWDVAIAIDRQMPFFSGRSSPRKFPRDLLLDAMLLYVSEVLDGPQDVPH